VLPDGIPGQAKRCPASVRQIQVYCESFAKLLSKHER
jgi:hypothetical protein